MTRRPASPITRRQIAAAHNFYSQGFGKGPVAIPAKRAPSRNLEHKEQAALMQWWMLSYKQFGVPHMALWANANGGPRDIIAGARLKAEGVRAGVYDLTLAVPRGAYHGAYIEMKSKDGRMSDSQTEFGKQIEFLGYKAVTCYGADEAIAFIQSYLGR